MKLRCFFCVNTVWARLDLILSLEDVQDRAIRFGLNPQRIQKRYGSHGLGFYYGEACIAAARIIKGELRTDVAGSIGQRILVLENGAAMSPEELDGYTIVSAKGSEMIWARGGAD